MNIIYILGEMAAYELRERCSSILRCSSGISSVVRTLRDAMAQ